MSHLLSGLGLLSLNTAMGTLSNFVAAQTPTAPSLSYLCSLNITTGTYSYIGNETGFVSGTRIMIPITGGNFTGLHGLSGTVAAIGGDWSLTAPDGTFHPDATMVLQTNDGASIIFKDNGYAPFAYVSFETGFEAYAWLNTVVAVAQIEQESYGVSMNVYELTEAES